MGFNSAFKGLIGGWTKFNKWVYERKNRRARYDIEWHKPETTYLVWSCRENGPNLTTKIMIHWKP